MQNIDKNIRYFLHKYIKQSLNMPSPPPPIINIPANKRKYTNQPIKPIPGEPPADPSPEDPPMPGDPVPTGPIPGEPNC
jgi:hypothetical protein